MLRLLKRLLRRKCDHVWVAEDVGKRSCMWCGQRQVLFWRPFPQVGEPSYRWDDVIG
jgi:hypothetical protein